MASAKDIQLQKAKVLRGILDLLSMLRKRIKNH
jgi:hypothetical protein